MEAIKYIGIDVHQATLVIAVMNKLGKVVAEAIIENKAVAIVDWLKSQRGRLWVTFEEGTYATWLYDLIGPHVEKVVVCDPRKNKLIQHGSKSDKVDARKLAELLRTNGLTAVYHGENSTRALKELAESYMALVEDCTRVKNRIKAMFRGRGIECAGETIYRVEEREQWVSQLSDKGARGRAERLLKELEQLDPLKEQAEKEMVRESRKHPARKILETIPGVAGIRAALIIAFVITPYRFRTKRQFWTYVGLAVVTRGSAEYELVRGQVRRTKKGVIPRGLNNNYNRVLKDVFKGAATTAVLRGQWKEYFDKQLERGTKPNLALLTVARKLSAVALVLWKKGESYDEQRLMKQTM
jgi:transposase